MSPIGDTPANARAAQIAAYNALRALLQRRFPSALLRTEWTGRRAIVLLYAAPADLVPLSAGVATGRRFDAIRDAAARAMEAAGFRDLSPIGDI